MTQTRGRVGRWLPALLGCRRLQHSLTEPVAVARPAMRCAADFRSEVYFAASKPTPGRGCPSPTDRRPGRRGRLLPPPEAAVGRAEAARDRRLDGSSPHRAVQQQQPSGHLPRPTPSRMIMVSSSAAAASGLLPSD